MHCILTRSKSNEWKFQSHQPIRRERIPNPGEKYVDVTASEDIIWNHKKNYGTSITKTQDIMPSVRGVIQSKFDSMECDTETPWLFQKWFKEQIELMLA